MLKDIDFGFDKIYIWDSKSLSDRTVPLPLKLKEELKVQVKHVEELHPQTLGRYIKQALVKSKVHKRSYLSYF